MTQDMRTGRYTQFIVTLLLLLMCGAGKVLADDITVMGKGAGSLETASAMLTDLINIIKNK